MLPGYAARMLPCGARDSGGGTALGQERRAGSVSLAGTVCAGDLLASAIRRMACSGFSCPPCRSPLGPLGPRPSPPAHSRHAA